MKDVVLAALGVMLLCCMMTFVVFDGGSIEARKSIGKIVSVIKECEAELPRNKTCKLIAVVDDGE